MMTGGSIAMLLSVAASLFLALRALRSQRLSFENKAWMAAVWVLIIALVAFVAQRLSA